MRKKTDSVMAWRSRALVQAGRFDWLRELGLLFALAALAVAPAASAVDLNTAVGSSGELDDLVVKEGVVQLPLEDAIRLALERNLGLVVERYRLTEAEHRLEQNFGIFDFNVTTNLLATEETSPTATSLGGAAVQTSETHRFDLGVSRLLPWGGTASAAFNNSRFETNSRFQVLNPQYRVDFDVSYSQPLLKNMGRDQTERGIRIARINRNVSRENFDLRVQQTIQLVENAYWTLVEAREQFAVAEESLGLARQLHGQNKIRVEVGTLAPLELVQSEAGIATREEAMIRARGAIGDAEDRLRQLLNVPADERWSTPFVPVTSAEVEDASIDLEAGLSAALEKRPELRSKRLSQKNLNQDIDYFRNQKLPSLDLQVRYGVNGVGGPATFRDFFTDEILGTAPGGYSDALDQAQGANFDGWQVSLNFAYPIENTSAKAQSALAEVSWELGEAELEDLQLGVLTEVRRLARFVDTADQALQSARVSRRLEERNLEAEQKRYDNGMSTSFQVLQIQEDLTEAKQREVNAITGLRKALVLYYQATGELMERNNVEVAEPETMKPTPSGDEAE